MQGASAVRGGPGRRWPGLDVARGGGGPGRRCLVPFLAQMTAQPWLKGPKMETCHFAVTTAASGTRRLCHEHGAVRSCASRGTKSRMRSAGPRPSPFPDRRRPLFPALGAEFLRAVGSVPQLPACDTWSYTDTRPIVRTRGCVNRFDSLSQFASSKKNPVESSMGIT